MNLTIKPHITVLIFTIASLAGCKPESESSLSPILPTLETKIVRFEQEFIDLNREDLGTSIDQLKERHPAFTNLLFTEILPINPETGVVKTVDFILSDTLYLNLYETVNNQYRDFTNLKQEINQTIENYLSIFSLPAESAPTLYTFISGFQYQGFVFNDTNGEGIAVGLELYLGDQFDYKSINPSDPTFSAYLTRTYNKEHLAKKIAEVLVEDKIPSPQRADFLSLIIWGGKKLYLIDQILNFKTDDIVMEYTPEQLAWCQANELQMWDFFFEKNLFYETNLTAFNKLIAPAPTSPGMPPESPGRTGNYMGWQIVKKYMGRNPNTSIQELINNQDAQQILDLSKYKPRR